MRNENLMNDKSKKKENLFDSYIKKYKTIIFRKDVSAKGVFPGESNKLFESMLQIFYKFFKYYDTLYHYIYIIFFKHCYL